MCAECRATESFLYSAASPNYHAGFIHPGRSPDGPIGASQRAAGPPICPFGGCPARWSRSVLRSRHLGSGRLAEGRRDVTRRRVCDSNPLTSRPSRRALGGSRALPVRDRTVYSAQSSCCSPPPPSLALPDRVRLFTSQRSLLARAGPHHLALASRRLAPMSRPRHTRPGTRGVATPFCDATPARGTP